ncbi:MAG: LTA synthase family protein [Succinivibrionaceae bacterium]|nr:LTA synthase family protein [Succinivibrionaceae bacterium]
MKEYFKRRSFALILSAGLACILLALYLMCMRWACLHILTSEAWNSVSATEQSDFWLMSLRFDLKFSAIALSPLILLALLLPSGRFASSFPKWGALYSALVFFYSGCAGIANYYYIKTYGHHFDLMVFGLVNEDTVAVIRSIWDGYPVVREFLFGIVAGFAAWLLLKPVFRRIASNEGWRNSVAAVALFLIFASVWAYFIRGDLGKFPLRRAAVAVTTNTAVNDHVPSGPLAFVWTVSDHMKESGRLLYADASELHDLAGFFGLPAPSGDDYRSVIAGNSRGLVSGKPHVVLAVMESMSADMLLFDNPDNFDIYGSLRKVLAHPKVSSFDNFISEGDGTIDSLGRILVRQGDNTDHSVGRYLHSGFFTSAALPFKEAGYHTVLVTAGNRGWRNLGDFAVANGFETVIDDSAIRLKNPQATGATWGLFDGEMFDAAYELLEESDRPVFMVLLSVTNHPPYQLPTGYSFSAISRPNPAVAAKYHNDDIYSMYETFRYANDMLGDFMLRIMNSPKLSGRSVVAATGDHNVRGLNVYQQNDAVILGHQVPFILYAPVELAVDKGRFASHKDILPTLYDLTLADGVYHYPGCSLVADASDCPYSFAYNGSVTVTSEGMCLYDAGVYRSYSLSGFKAVAAADNASCRVSEAYRKLTEWYYRYQTAGLKEQETKKKP